MLVPINFHIAYSCIKINKHLVSIHVLHASPLFHCPATQNLLYMLFPAAAKQQSRTNSQFHEQKEVKLIAAWVEVMLKTL